MTRFRLDVEYDGGRFCGWQRQEVCLGVQGALEKALTRLHGHPVTVDGSGRTDTGVHALGQVAQYDTSNPRPVDEVRQAVNALTPPEVSVTRVSEAPENFHVRFSAVYREYLYRINNRIAPPPLDRERVWHLFKPLDAEAMNAAAAAVLGHHDFSAFRAAACQSQRVDKTLERLEAFRTGDEVHIIAGARSFLHHMVRNLVGSLVMVGHGKWPPERLREVLDARDRQKAGPTAPAHGLYFTGAWYPGEKRPTD